MKSYWMVSGEAGSYLELRDVNIPTPGLAKVLVKMRAASLNRGEFIHGHGLHATGSAKPAGMEGAGEIIQLGEGVTGFEVGQLVMGRCPGAFSEFALMDQHELIPVPSGLSLEKAAAISLTFLVTHDLLVLQGQLQAGQWLLINGVSSGVGVACLQMAKILGARVIGTSGSQDKLDQLKSHGLDLALCTRKPDFQETVMQATLGLGVNLAVNAVGGSVFAESLSCLAFGGRMGIVGYVDGSLSAPINLEVLHSKRLTIFGVSNKFRSPSQRAQGVAPFVAQILPAFADGRLQPHIDSVYPFEKMAEARARMESNQHTGKIVLRMV